MAAQRSAPDPESRHAARDAGDLHRIRLGREVPRQLLYLERRGEKAASAAAWSRRRDGREGGDQGRGPGREAKGEEREGGDRSGLLPRSTDPDRVGKGKTWERKRGSWGELVRQG